jgi:predicted Ser/Thr protein kinase
MNEPEQNPSMEKKCPHCGVTLPTGALEGLCPACLLKQGATPDTGSAPEAVLFQPPTVEEVARLFPQLEILAFIGKGGMGAVYRAKQPALDRLVALKILPPQAATSPGFSERFNREARALAKLSHPNIVAIYDFGQLSALPYFVMEFVDGLNLRQLERAGKLSPREALEIVPQICAALQFAHDEGIVHRDIKPENILLDKKGRVKIADFGIAKLLGQEPEIALTETRGVLGTPQYMAPEQVEKPQAVDHRADIFSLGVVFYEMLTGELPLGRFAPPSSRMAGVKVDVRLDDVVLRALEKEPERRYQQASQVKTAVETIASTAPPPPTPDAASLAGGILAADYALDIRNCFRRGWKLVRANFWPLIGITALVVVLLSFVVGFGSAFASGLAHAHPALPFAVLMMLIWGPLSSGLCLYFLRKIRGETSTIEIAFSGFGTRFLDLFLAGFAVSVFTAAGFACLVLPGIYLLIAWSFALPLVIDQGLDFWTAMQLSRKVVTRRWWKFFSFALLLLLLSAAGTLAFGIGVLVTVPVALASMMYAYEDVFGAAARSVKQPTATMGPSGTVVMPSGTRSSPPSASVLQRPVVVGLTALALFMVLLAILGALHTRKQRQLAEALVLAVEPPAVDEASGQPNGVGEVIFGPVIDRVLEYNTPDRHRALRMATGEYVTPDAGTQLDFSPTGAESLRAAGADIYLPDPIANAIPSLRVLDWRRLEHAPTNDLGVQWSSVEAVSPAFMRQQLEYWKTTGWDGPDAIPQEKLGEYTETLSKLENVIRSRHELVRQLPQDDAAAQRRDPRFQQLTSQINDLIARKEALESENPSLAQRHQEDFADSRIKLFVTKDGSTGVLQIGRTDAGFQIRYKLVEQMAGISGKTQAKVRESLANRLEAASSILGSEDRDRALAKVAKEAARLGQPEIVQKAIPRVLSVNNRDDTSRECALILAKHGFPKQAVDIAKRIIGNQARDQTLLDLAK